MDTIRVIANSFATAETTDPECTAFVASDKHHRVEVMMQTMQTPLACASLLVSAQKGVLGMNPAKVADDLAWNIDNAKMLIPDAVDIIRNGDIICINVGCGGLFFKLTDRARESLWRICDDI